MTFMDCTALKPSVFIPAFGDSYWKEVYTNLVLTIMRRGVETAPPTNFIIMILHVLRATVDFRIVEHVWGKFIALDEHIIADHRTGMP